MTKSKELYGKFITIIFFLYLTGMLSFGRAFSILHVRIGPIPVFITEIFLLVSLPLVIIERKKLLGLPKEFLILLSAFFLIGFYYLGSALLKGNLYSLRDVVLCGYILFLPITYIVLSKYENFRQLTYLFILSNLISIFVARMCIFYIIPSLQYFCFNSRFFNFGLYFGFAVSFFVCLLFFEKDEKKIFLWSVFSLLNIYMLLIVGERALWLGLFVLVLFFIFTLGFNFFKIPRNLLPLFGLFIIILIFLDFKFAAPSNHIAEIKAKANSAFVCFDNIFCANRSTFSNPNVTSTPNGKSISTNELKKVSSLAMQVELLNKARRSSKANDRWALDNLFWRLKIWNQTFKFGLSSPIFGKGFGVSPDYQIWNTNVDGEGKLVKRLGCDSNVIPPHNDLLTVFYKMGFLGLGLFLLINLYVLFFGFNWIYSQPNNNMKFLVLGSLGAFIFWHILAFFFNVIDSPSTAVFIWIIMGIIFATVNIGKSIVTNNRA